MYRIKVELQQIKIDTSNTRFDDLMIGCHVERQTNKKRNNDTYRERTAFAKIVNDYS